MSLVIEQIKDIIDDLWDIQYKHDPIVLNQGDGYKIEVCDLYGKVIITQLKDDKVLFQTIITSDDLDEDVYTYRVVREIFVD